MSLLKIWISAARPRTLPLSVSGILAGTAVALQQGFFDAAIFTLALLTTLGFQILSNFANDYGDGIKGTDSQDRIGPARALQSGALSSLSLKKAMTVTAAITLVLAGMTIYFAFGKDHPAMAILFFLLGLAAIVAAITYTVGRHAYGYKAMGDVFVFLFFGLLAVSGTYFLYAKDLPYFIWLPAASIGLLSVAVLNLNNMRDIASDTTAGKTTLAILLGVQKAKRYHMALIIFSFVTAIGYFLVVKPNIWQYISMLAFLPLFVHLWKVKSTDDPRSFDPELKKVALSTFAFSLLLLLTAI